MTWFISTSDIIWLVIACLVGWVMLSLVTAIKALELLKLSSKGVLAWTVVGLCAVAYGAPIAYIAWRIAA